ncbi:GyrI-like domain-containing protein [Mucilaginibacter sp. 14171R-50]|uniref:GyrI-like domain-containing protein n=1 Tax=Mucilaginibacter sp. 14171R-50 TaxID=2703789 RepID=UPI001EE417E0|nr:GyrI-like domain-containing protein [Mucilaginibacter sp. 14171R-50]
MMQPQIRIIPEKKMVGNHVLMTLAQNKTGELFRGFMPRRNEIQNKVSNDIICMQAYDPNLNFNDVSIDTPHQKWAAVEVTDYSDIPKGMETFTIPGGMYAVFLYKGNPAAYGPTFNYIFNTWLPASAYEVDNRPHFEILGEKYKNNDSESEEDIWVPVRFK